MLNKLQFQNLAELQLQNLELQLASFTAIKFTKRYGVSQWVSYWQALPMIGLGFDKNAITAFSKNDIKDVWRKNVKIITTSVVRAGGEV